MIIFPRGERLVLGSPASGEEQLTGILERRSSRFELQRIN
jgi:hypothetical protein